MFLELIKRVEGHLLDELPFVVYRKPNSGEVCAIFQKDDALNYTYDFTEKGFVFAPFDSHAPTILMHLDEQLTADISDMESSKSDAGNFLDVDTFDKEFHLELVQKGIQQIKEGDFDKVVLSRKLEVESLEDPLKIFKRVLSTYNSAFCYLWYHPKVGMWLGATPEILLRTENNSLTTMSLAGTYSAISTEFPVWGQKEMNEQLIVTDYITNALKDEVSNLRISEVESVKAGNLWHLRTKITADFKNNLSPIIKALHPTPAVCGMPLPSARKFIYENEKYDREYYTGFLGELNLTKEIHWTKNNKNQENKSYRAVKTITELFVNLRCMKLTEGNATIFVGGGITKDSIPEQEWLETIAKSKTMLGILAKDQYL